ncbi:MAG: hypothetical protein KDA35_00525 [Hyphomonadaceae bacterium]|nr:hypothetical protein [Hyphomonadaceae bacterium]
MRTRLRTGDLLTEHGEQNPRWRVADYWRDVVEIESLDGSGRRRFLYQDEFTSGARFRLAPADRT